MSNRVVMPPTETELQARAAVAAFLSMRHSLTSYARAITGKPSIRVEATSATTRTDGKTIFIRPPIRLGSRAEHNMLVCDKRDENMRQLCPACEIRESVLVLIYHEIGHIAFDSFAKVSDSMKKRILADVAKAKVGPTTGFIELAQSISEYLPLLLNAIEDGRVNRAVSDVRPGTRLMFQADTRRALADGVSQRDAAGNEVMKLWSEYPLNAQFCIAIYALICKYDITGLLAPEIHKAMKDEELARLAETFASLRDVEGSFTLSMQMLNRARELGYLMTEEERKEFEDESQQDDTPEQGVGTEEPDAGEQPDDEAGGDSGADEDSEVESDSGEPEDSSVDADGGSDNTDSGEAAGGTEDSGSLSDDDTDEKVQEASDGSEGEPSSDSQSAGSPSVSSEGDEDDVESEGTGSAGEPSSDSGDENGQLSEPGEAGNTDGSDSLGGKPQESEESSGSEDLPDDKGADADDDTEGDAELPEGSSSNIGDEQLDPDYEVRRLPMGLAEEIEGSLSKVMHPEHGADAAQSTKEDIEIDVAVEQGEYFERPSSKITGVVVNKRGDGPAYEYKFSRRYTSEMRLNAGIDGDFEVEGGTISKALMQMRIALADNKRSHEERNRKSGKVNARVLGRRAPFHDERLFKHRTIPGKKDYFVLIGIDISGSNHKQNLTLAKRSAMAQAEVCARLGVKFAVYAHTGEWDSRRGGTSLSITEIKTADEPWDMKAREALTSIQACSANIDGHTLEFYRKVLDRRTETDRIIMYYTDGKMPAENYVEELEILQREIKTIAKKKYLLLGVGIRTEAPTEHGLPTCRVDDDGDVIEVVKYLQGRLLGM